MTSKNDTQGLPLPAIRVETAETGHGLDLDAIEARERAATPGPWGCVPPDGTVYWPRVGTVTGGIEGIDKPRDAEFIAAARSDVPALVAEVRRLRVELDETRKTEETYDRDNQRLRQLIVDACDAKPWQHPDSNGICPWCNGDQTGYAPNCPHAPDCPAFTPTGDVR